MRAREIPTGLLFVQRDEGGAPIEPPEGALAVYEVLSAKKFAVTVLPADPHSLAAGSDCAAQCASWARAGKDAGVKRIVCVGLRVAAYDTVAGYEVAKVMANAALYDIGTGALVRTWQTQRSGTGLTPELARVNAFREAGKALGNLLSTTMP